MAVSRAVDLLRCEELVCRAWDEAMNTQPNMLTWNLMGALARGPACALLTNNLHLRSEV